MNLDVKDARTVEVLFGEPRSHSFWKGGPCAVQLKTFKIFCSSLTLSLQLYVKNEFTVERKNIFFVPFLYSWSQGIKNRILLNITAARKSGSRFGQG